MLKNIKKSDISCGGFYDKRGWLLYFIPIGNEFDHYLVANTIILVNPLPAWKMFIFKGIGQSAKPSC